MCAPVQSAVPASTLLRERAWLAAVLAGFALLQAALAMAALATADVLALALGLLAGALLLPWAVGVAQMRVHPPNDRKHRAYARHVVMVLFVLAMGWTACIVVDRQRISEYAFTPYMVLPTTKFFLGDFACEWGRDLDVHVLVNSGAARYSCAGLAALRRRLVCFW